MDTRVCIDKVTNLTDFKSECSLLKSSLHLTICEEAKISTLSGTSALAELLCDLIPVLLTLNLLLELSDILNCLILAPCNWFVPERIIWVSRARVFL